eukprot:jgi/Picsp_1/6744/NSC_04085-R1_tetratricopeptide repeat protein 4 homolog
MSRKLDSVVPGPTDGLPALFWDEMPEGEGNADLAAINAIIDETSPEERVSGFKDQGNRALKTGLEHRKKYYLRQAIEQYTQGIKVEGCQDNELISQVFSNRAHVNLLLGNYRNALMDAKDAIRFDPKNVKGYYRAAKAAAAISLWKECRQFCNNGLELDPDNEGIRKILEDSDKEEDRRKKASAAEAARQYELRRPAARLADILLSRGWKMGRPQFGIGNRKPRIDTDEIRWPVLFFYPEASMQNDAIEDFGEFDTFGAHLDVMFDPEAPPLEWDSEPKEIGRNELIEALFGGWPSIVDEGPTRYGPKGATWVRIDESDSLGEIIGKQDHVIPGVPVFFLLSKDTPRDFRENFLNGEMPLL